MSDTEKPPRYLLVYQHKTIINDKQGDRTETTEYIARYGGGQSCILLSTFEVMRELNEVWDSMIEYHDRLNYLEQLEREQAQRT
jgi:hypothetical protein